MDRADYQNLRFCVENDIANFNDGIIDDSVLANSLMRHFLQAISTEQVKRQSSKRKLLTFRRDPNAIPPVWAYRKPGIESRLLDI